MAFQPGQSGNPGGRPKESKEAREAKRLAGQHSARAIERLRELLDGDDPRVSVSAAQALLDRAFGKPAQPVTGGDEDDNPIQTHNVHTIALVAIDATEGRTPPQDS